MTEIERLEDQLKPCPFCGCELVKLRANNQVWWVECADCTACGPSSRNFRIASSAWNGREQ